MLPNGILEPVFWYTNTTLPPTAKIWYPSLKVVLIDVFKKKAKISEALHYKPEINVKYLLSYVNVK